MPTGEKLSKMSLEENGRVCLQIPVKCYGRPLCSLCRQNHVSRHDAAMPLLIRCLCHCALCQSSIARAVVKINNQRLASSLIHHISMSLVVPGLDSSRSCTQAAHSQLTAAVEGKCNFMVFFNLSKYDPTPSPPKRRLSEWTIRVQVI